MKPNLFVVLVFTQAGAQAAAAGGLRAPPCVHMADLQRQEAGQLLRVRRRRGGHGQPSAEGRLHHHPLSVRSQVSAACFRDLWLKTPEDVLREHLSSPC